jgi:hypothetical protein
MLRTTSWEEEEQLRKMGPPFPWCSGQLFPSEAYTPHCGPEGLMGAGMNTPTPLTAKYWHQTWSWLHSWSQGCWTGHL